MVKTWKVFLLALLILFGPTACDFLFGGCPKTLPYFHINGLEIYPFQYTGQGLNPWETVGGGEEVPWDKFFMRVGFKPTYYAENHFKGTSNLYALSCEEHGYAGAKVGVDTLYLLALTNYNSQYLQNDTLNAIVAAHYWTYDTNDFEDFFPLAHLVEENRTHIRNQTFELKLTEPPLHDKGAYRFKLVLVLSNGEVKEAESGMVQLSR